MKYATVLSLLVGCASVDDAPALSGPTLEVSVDSAVHVTAPDYKMDFSDTGIRLPAHLTVSEIELLGTEDCSENLIGVAVAPAVAVAAGMPHGSDAVRSEITTVLSGPAVAKVHVTFEVDYHCPTKQTVAGAIDFTMFPGGRIVREDLAIKPSTDRLTKAGNCGCQQETNPTNFHDLVFSSYWAFRKTGATQVQPNGTRVDPLVDDLFAACTMYPELAIGVAWNQQSNTGTRYSPHETASHVLAWSTDSDPSMLDPTPQSMTSAIQIADTPGLTDCAAVLALLADVPLEIGSTRLGATDHDGIYRDATVHTSAFDIKPVTEPIPSDFAISVDLGGADHAVLHPAGIAATAQREDGNRFVIVFRDGMNLGDVITIEPRR
jgi:hypothetical protein